VEKTGAIIFLLLDEFIASNVRGNQKFKDSIELMIGILKNMKKFKNLL